MGLLTIKNSTNTGESSALFIHTRIPVSLTEHVLRLPCICYLILERQEVVVYPKSGYTDRVYLQIVVENPTNWPREGVRLTLIEELIGLQGHVELRKPVQDMMRELGAYMS